MAANPKMSMNDYQVSKVIGEGAYGRAILCTHKATKTQVVIKEIALNNLSCQEQREAKKETKVLSLLHHPNIISYRGSFMQNNKLHIVMDYADGGDLFEQIQKAKMTHFSEDKVLDWFVQICLALKHIHDRKILHRDIKCQNIFLMKNGVIKMGDFGIAKVLDHTTQLSKTAIGTPYYLSPEICQGKAYNAKSDVWSLGCVLYELCTLQHAFDSNCMNGLIMKILRSKHAPIPYFYSANLRNLVDSLLQKAPNKRPSINGILRLDFIHQRIGNLLSQTMQQIEFSHTVFHGCRGGEEPKQIPKKELAPIAENIPDNNIQQRPKVEPVRQPVQAAPKPAPVAAKPAPAPAARPAPKPALPKNDYAPPKAVQPSVPRAVVQAQKAKPKPVYHEPPPVQVNLPPAPANARPPPARQCAVQNRNDKPKKAAPPRQPEKPLSKDELQHKKNLMVIEEREKQKHLREKKEEEDRLAQEKAEKKRQEIENKMKQREMERKNKFKQLQNEERERKKHYENLEAPFKKAMAPAPVPARPKVAPKAAGGPSPKNSQPQSESDSEQEDQTPKDKKKLEVKEITKRPGKVKEREEEVRNLREEIARRRAEIRRKRAEEAKLAKENAQAAPQPVAVAVPAPDPAPVEKPKPAPAPVEQPKPKPVEEKPQPKPAPAPVEKPKPKPEPEPEPEPPHVPKQPIDHPPTIRDLDDLIHISDDEDYDDDSTNDLISLCAIANNIFNHPPSSDEDEEEEEEEIVEKKEQPKQSGGRFFFDGKELVLPMVTDRDSMNYRIEALRQFIEEGLGLDKFIETYQFITEQSDEMDEANVDKELKKILETHEQQQYLTLIQQMIVCEESDDL